MWWGFLTGLLLPPGGPILLGLLGLLLWRRAVGRGLIMLSLVLLYLASTPLASMALVAPLERGPVLDLETAVDADAIVVLAGGRAMEAPEYGGETVSLWTLERIRYAARLQRRLQLPLLVSGGDPQGLGTAEADLMVTALEQDFGAPVTWVESRSRNTQENAYYSAAILREEGVSRIILVTRALHMPRSVEAFRRAGVEEISAAPTGYFRRPSHEPHPGLRDLLPHQAAMTRTGMALHEYLGRLWYRIIYRRDQP